MKDEDVLITEYRVTALGESGQYIFDWVDEDANTVKFVPSESDFDDFNKEVENVLNRNGVSIIRDESEQNDNNFNSKSGSESQSVESTTEDIGQPDPIGSTTPPDNSDSDSNSDSSETVEDAPNDEFKPVDGSNSSSQSTEPTNESPEDHSSNKQVSFLVRMSDPSDRRDVIREIQDEYPDVADQLELSGPFEVTYEINPNGLELVKVEDLGTGTSIN